ncbi:MAG: Unknown protein [uncultured Aureispira sp.]|uniref:Lipocalin-like domain-containing protein n=1 Tax=uncultured Aureispira sp. TaxID=1331704 RepID=A0A6S6TZT5_9BACT|nr:MAG: Unknown protein [uncultured Aureispira sp.]
MKPLILLVSCLFLLCLNTSCEKAGQIHLISAHTWVVTDVSNPSNFTRVGDELSFLDNRLFFNNSNGFETDGEWDFIVSGTRAGLFTSYNINEIAVTSGFSSYSFSIVNLTAKELEIRDISGLGALNIRLKAKE